MQNFLEFELANIKVSYSIDSTEKNE